MQKIIPFLTPFLFILFAGKLPASEKTDSLQLILKSAKSQDKLEVFKELALSFSVNNFDSAFHYTQKLKEESKALKNREYQGIAHKIEGNIYFRKGNPNQAEICYNSALNEFKAINNRNEEGNVYNNLGLLMQSQGKYLIAIQHLENSLLIFENSGNEMLQSGPLINLGIIHFKTGDYSAASIKFLQALAIAQKFQHQESMANITNNLGAIYKEWGKYSKALQFYEKSLSLRAILNDLQGEASTCHNIGVVYEELGNYDEAIVWVLKGMNLKKRMGAESKLGLSLIKLGDIYTDWKKYELALNNYNEGIVFSEKVGDKLNVGNALTGTADVYYKTEMYNQALSGYKEAIKLFKELNSKRELAGVYCKLASLQAEKFSNFNIADDYFDKSEALLESLESDAGKAQLYYDKGKSMLTRKQYSKAISLLTNSAKLLPENNYHQLKVYSLLAEAYQLNQQLNKSVFAYKKALDLKDSVFNTKANLQLAKYEVKFNTHQKQTEIIRLNQQSEVDKIEIKKKKTVQNLFLIFSSILLISLIVIIYINIQLKKVNQKLKLQQAEIENQKKKLEEANNDLLTAKTNAERLSGFKSQFLANISHEIRTPLNAILGYSKLIKGKLEKTENINYAQNIENASENLLIIINDLIDFSRIEAGKLVIEKTEFNPVGVLTQTLSTLRLKAEAKNIKLDLHFDPDLPELLLGDPYRLSQILVNLISNAIKFSSKGQTVAIEAKCESQNNHCSMFFSIKDQGIGIESKMLDHIFESFTQIKTNTIRNKGGTGLGLAIVKRLIELQNGDISVESKVNEGSTFRFTITYEKTTATKLQPRKNTDEVDSPKTTDKKVRILLVEDNEINQELAKDTIKSWGDNFEVTVAENGRIAINILEQEEFDVVLMDIQMPEMNGHETTEHIRKNMPEKVSKIPIIGMTAHALESEKSYAFEKGMDEYIIKPFNPDELKQKIISFVIR